MYCPKSLGMEKGACMQMGHALTPRPALPPAAIHASAAEPGRYEHISPWDMEIDRDEEIRKVGAAAFCGA